MKVLCLVTGFFLLVGCSKPKPIKGGGTTFSNITVGTNGTWEICDHGNCMETDSGITTTDGVRRPDWSKERRVKQ